MSFKKSIIMTLGIFILCPYLIYGDDILNSEGNKITEARLGDKITIKLDKFSALLEKKKTENKNIALFINAKEIKELRGDIDAEHGQIYFTLERTPGSKKTWEDLLGQPNFPKFEEIKSVKIAVGLEDGYPEHSQDFHLIALKKDWHICSTVTLIAVLVLFFSLAAKTNILRNPGPALPFRRKRPYSLAKLQMAVWTFIILYAFIFIWMVTGALDSVSGSVLVLMGIASGTSLGAAIIDQNNDITEEIYSQGFFQDILTNDQGSALHRFQMLIWSFVLWVIFIVSVMKSLSMPEFNESLLALMGISSGTYLGFKVPENKNWQAPSQPRQGSTGPTTPPTPPAFITEDYKHE